MEKKVLTAENVREVFDYDEETGKLYWRVDSNKNNLAGSEAGKLYGDQRYLKISWGRCILVHRVVWLWFYGEWPKYTVDHIDGDKFNHRLENLRDVTTQENSKGFKTPYGSMQINGVSHSSGRFIVKIRRDKIGYTLGSYETLLEAACARKSAELEYLKTGRVTPRGVELSKPHRVRGVQYLKRSATYRASRMVKGVTYRLGSTFTDRFDAICAVKSFEAKIRRGG